MQQKIEPFDALSETLDKMRHPGIILVAGDPPNPMTIGWGTLGTVWSRPVFQVLVRPTRYTYDLIERSETFTVNVFDNQFKKEIGICGTQSGRDTDKVKKCGFTMVPGLSTESWFIDQASLHYECQIVHKHLLDDKTLDQEIIHKYYPIRDYHMVYYGEILGVYRQVGG